MQDQEIMQELNIVLVGPKHSGKTIFLTALANCGSISVENPESIAELRENWKLLKQGETPPATAGTLKDMSFAFRTENEGACYNVNISISDYDGHFAETLSQQTEESPEKKALCEKIKAADGFIIFFPCGDKDDVATMEELRMEIGYFIKMLREVCDEDESITAPAILAVNKWDKNEAFKTPGEDESANEYIQSIEVYRVIADKLRNFFKELTVLPMSAYGHKTPDAAPLPGQIAPYRVDEAVFLIVDSFFKNFQNTVLALKENDQTFDLAYKLLLCQPVWSRCEGMDYSGLLEDALERCYSSLLEQASACSTLKDFDACVGAAPEYGLLNNFSPEQQLEISRIQQRLKSEYNARRNRKVAIGGGVLAAVLAVSGLFWAHHQRSQDYLFAMDSTGTVNERIDRLNQYEEKYANNLLMLGMHKDDLKNVGTVRDDLVEGLRSGFMQGLNQAQSEGDSCKRTTLTEHMLLDTAYIEPALIEKAKTLHDQSQRICQNRAVVENPQASAVEVEDARQQLSALPATPERDDMLRRLAEKGEQERVGEILQEFNRLGVPTQDEDGYEEAQALIAQYENDTSAEVQNHVATLRQSLGDRLYCALMGKIGKISGFDMEKELHELKELVTKEGGKGLLSVDHKRSIASAMQERLERLDRESIDAIGDSFISTRDELANRKEKLQQNNSLLGKADLDYELFRYERPSGLADRVARIQQNIHKYEDALSKGVSVEWQIYATENNPLRAGCGRLQNNKVSFTFSSIMGMANMCSASEDTRYESKFEYGRKTVGVMHGRIVIRQSNLIKGLVGDREISGILSISEEDIFTLINTGRFSEDIGNGFCVVLRTSSY